MTDNAGLQTGLQDSLFAWYDRQRRALPWRAEAGETPDAYRVWLSEIMLQQTTVAAVVPYFLSFVRRWPTVESLADAELDQVLAAWAGLGYYARARNLHKCARLVVQARSGRFPTEEAELRGLPGVGAYTAAAIAAIVFGRPATAVDGNVERVMARLFAVAEVMPAARPTLVRLAAGLTPASRAGDYAQAVMDLGATVCTPRNPACGICPWLIACEGRRQGIAETLPRRAAKPERPRRHGMAFWIVRSDGAVLLRRRPDSGLLGAMMEVPSTPWRDEPWTLADAVDHSPLPSTWSELTGVVRHTFTHFHLDLAVALGRAGRRADARGIWVPLDRLAEHALPTLMRKVVAHALRKGYQAGQPRRTE